jgi:polygalacturonase
VLVENVRIVGAPFWVVHPVYSQNVIARGLRIESRYPNNDGVDPDSCVDVLIERCAFDTGDDSVAVKSGRDQDGWRVGQPTENVVIRDCDMNSQHAGLCIGSEMSAGVRNVFLENCRLGKVETAIYFKSNLDRGGLVEHIRVRGMTVREAVRTIHFTTDYHGYRGGKFPTAFRDIEIERVTCGKAGTGIRAVGVPDSPIRDITMRDVTIGTTANPNEIRHVANLRLTNVRVNGVLLK